MATFVFFSGVGPIIVSGIIYELNYTDYTVTVLHHGRHSMGLGFTVPNPRVRYS